jgi:Fe-S-cluster containining protein
MKSNGDGYTCIALSEDGRCTIWDKRPQMCRDFEVESERCKAIRKEYNRP